MEAVNLLDLKQWRDAHPDRPLIVHGAGDLGKLAFHALAQAGIAVDTFCDGSALKHGTRYRGVPIISPDALAASRLDARVIIANNYMATVVPSLEDMGFRDLCHCAALFDDTDFSNAEVDVHSLEIQRKIAWHQRECSRRPGQETTLVLKYMDIVVTEACSMKCIDCSNLMQYYKRVKNADTEHLFTCLDRIMAATDGVDELRVLGGEPFINKNLAAIVTKLTSYPNHRHIVLYTNGTLMPPKGALEVLRNDKVSVNITDYGAHSRRLGDLTAALDGAGIAYLVKTPFWTDSGRILHRPRSADQLDAVFKNCCVSDVLSLLNGRLYRCPFSANGTNLGAIPAVADDIVAVEDIMDPQQLRSEIARLYDRATPLKACEYCNGRDYTTPKIEPALQTARPLDVPAPVQSTEKA